MEYLVQHYGLVVLDCTEILIQNVNALISANVYIFCKYSLSACHYVIKTEEEESSRITSAKLNYERMKQK